MDQLQLKSLLASCVACASSVLVGTEGGWLMPPGGARQCSVVCVCAGDGGAWGRGIGVVWGLEGAPLATVTIPRYRVRLLNPQSPVVPFKTSCRFPFPLT